MDPKHVLYKIVDGIEKGLITPESLSLGGALETEIARQLIWKVRDASTFLSKVTVKPVGKIKASFKLMDIASEILVRVTQGGTPTDEQLVELNRSDVNYTNLATQLFYTLTFDDLRDNKSNPTFETEIETNIAKAFANDLTRLGFRGVGDDYAGNAWGRLNKGWLQVAKESVPLGQRINTAGYTTLCEIFDAMLDALPDKWNVEEETPILVSPSDYRAWVKEMIADGSDVLALARVTGKLPAYMGHPVVSDTQMVTGEHTLGNLKNFWMTVLTVIERYREVSGRKRCIDYTYDYSFDFGLGIPEATVIAWDQGY